MTKATNVTNAVEEVVVAVEEKIVVPEKATKKDMYNILLSLDAVKGVPELVKFVENEISLLDSKKAKAQEKRAKSSGDNAKLQNEIIEVLLTKTKPVRITEIQKGNAKLENLSNQKMSSLLKGLVEIGKVEKTIEKKLTYFAVKIA
jgi:hypothetical protein